MLAEPLPTMHEEIARSYLKSFQECLALSARRGYSPGDMPGMIARLAMWLRNGDTEFMNWNNLINEAGQLWLDWYDWYSRIYTRPNEVLCGLSIDEWMQL